MTTDVRDIVRDRILASGVSPKALGAAVADAWGCSPRSAETTIHEDFLGGDAALHIDALGPLLCALGLRLAPGPEQPMDVRGAVRERLLALGGGAYVWTGVAPAVAAAWGLSPERAREILIKTFGARPNRGMRIDKLGAVLDACGMRIEVASTKDEDPG